MEVKLPRLFGFEVISDTVGEKRLKGFEDGDRSVESFGEENGIGKSLDKASYEMDKTAKEKISRHELEHKKYECQFFPKEFRNPQAFGGRPNAHKKERLKRRRMQLQEKSNSCNFYLDPSQAQNNLVYHNSLPRKQMGAIGGLQLVLSSAMRMLPYCLMGAGWVVRNEEARSCGTCMSAQVLPCYENYITHAFPHDELKPLTKSFTDSLSELGNLKLEHLPQDYNGSALRSLNHCLGNYTEFGRAVLWLSENLKFDVDARVNLFECNIRVLGGLISAHLLATDSTNRLLQGSYKHQLLWLAEDLGQRFLPAFDTPSGLPYAWINLKYGVMENETTEQAPQGSLILEMGALSQLTGDPRYESAALRALRKLWSMRSSLNLLGTTLDVATGEWIEHSSGIGAGVDSFYEYLYKAHILFGKEDFWRMFHSAYLAVQKYFRHGPWYHEADMRTGKATYWQLTSLQAFWPGLQVLVGDIAAANSSHREFFYLWKKFGVLPERYLLDHLTVHPTEKYYPLRPELAESTFYLYQATKGASIYLLFDDSFLVNRNYIFTTEGHPLPVLSAWHDRLPETYIPSNWTYIKNEKQVKQASAMSQQVCPAMSSSSGDDDQGVESACHVPDARSDHRCFSDEECGVDAISCRRRSCSIAGYCGLWLFI
ncbi:hypothetical protein GH714_040834 [Hevea brasiliensis]|uniref:alpha-1,2-Mannosidase n=1 Tax=Hevea brasiliensis TaxID=3981 RepID=A0A6A6MVQ0_HEVBR|nr:hypothetical protein GH714_040834 [Hevea brasiliensis]